MSVDAAFERSVRRWLWAYPRRWRWQRADEVVGTLADLAAPGATRLDLRSGLGLVVHGLATRRRMRPPLRHTLLYGALNIAPPWQYRGWLADRIASPFFNRGPLGGAAIYIVVFTVMRTCSGEATRYDLIFAGAVVIACCVTPRTAARRRAASRQLVGRPGEPPTPWDQRPAWVYRDRVTARSMQPTLAMAGGAVTVGAATLTFVTGSGPVAPLAACGLVGVAVATRLAVRWRLRVPTRPMQPARRLLVAAPALRAAAWCWGAVALASVFSWPLSGLMPPTSLAPILFGAALLALPALVVGWLLARREPDDLAAVDVFLLATAGPLRVDTLQRGIAPAWQAPPAPGAVPLMGGPPALPPTPGTAAG